MYQRVMVATDLIRTNDATLAKAVELCRQCGAALTILHVLESASRDDRGLVRHFRSGLEIRADGNYREEVRAALDACHHPLLTADSGINHEIRIETGFPWEKILQRAGQERSDLIVMGPHSQRAAQMGVLRIAGRVGSTAQGVIMQQPCPVMIVNPKTTDTILAFQQLLVCIDFSQSCRHAFHYALSLARQHASRIALFHMLPVPPSAQYTQAAYHARLAYAKQRLADWVAASAQDIDCRVHVRGGVHPHLEITRLAARLRTDLILMGSHTRDDGPAWYVGSVVERTSHRCHCPLMVVGRKSLK